jgi:hypothetical protein
MGYPKKRRRYIYFLQLITNWFFAIQFDYKMMFAKKQNRIASKLAELRAFLEIVQFWTISF